MYFYFIEYIIILSCGSTVTSYTKELHFLTVIWADVYKYEDVSVECIRENGKRRGVRLLYVCVGGLERENRYLWGQKQTTFMQEFFFSYFDFVYINLFLCISAAAANILLYCLLNLKSVSFFWISLKVVSEKSGTP